jgi:hypothetical protein
VPFTVVEFRESRRHYRAKDTESAELMFVGFGDANNQTAAAAFDVAIPATFTPLAGGNTLKLLSRDITTVGGGFWRATAHYGPDNAPIFPAVGGVGPPEPVPTVPGLTDPLGPDFAFDFTGVTEHITQSKETVSSVQRFSGVGPAPPGPDTQRAIGITADGRVEGCERIRPNLEWSVTRTFAAVTHDYIMLVASLVGTVNDDTFYGRPAGECLFVGGNCQIDDTMRAKCTFKFLDSPNLTNIEICDDLTVTAKKGHEYLWVAYRDAKDGNRITQQPDAAYVEKIYDLADFAQLRIGE